jgi:hypothetical protein
LLGDLAEGDKGQQSEFFELFKRTAQAERPRIGKQIGQIPIAFKPYGRRYIQPPPIQLSESASIIFPVIDPSHGSRVPGARKIEPDGWRLTLGLGAGIGMS